jgi:RNA polymerase sigma-70 factor (ECF subfamily)
MRSDTANWGLVWTHQASQDVAVSQRWVLTAMQRHGQALVSMLWRILGNEQDVCDAYQDTFVQLAYRTKAEIPKNIKAFTFRCAANTAVTLLRRRRMQERYIGQLSRAARPADVDPAGDMDHEQLRQSLRTYIARLPEKLRDVVLLKDLAELPYEQVAAMLEITVASARVYRCRALRLLSCWLTRREEVPDETH